MKRMIPVMLVVIVGTMALIVFGQTPAYLVGAAKCQICHRTEKQGRQYPIWEASRHASSFANLSSDKAAANALAAGVKDPVQDPKCLKCHAPLFIEAPDLKAEGVTCEVCHGPGSEYNKFSIMKDKAEAVKKGLLLYGSPEARKALCLTCHGSAHNVPFDFAAAWDKIKHSIPNPN